MQPLSDVFGLQTFHDYMLDCVIHSTDVTEWRLPEQLWAAIGAAWTNISPQLFRPLVESMPRTVTALRCVTYTILSPCVAPVNCRAVNSSKHIENGRGGGFCRVALCSSVLCNSGISVCVLQVPAASRLNCVAERLKSWSVDETFIHAASMFTYGKDIIPQARTEWYSKVPTHDIGGGGSADIVVRLLASHVGEPGSIPGWVAPGFSHVGIVPDDDTDRRVFLGISRFPRPFIPALLLTHLASPSSVLKTSIRWKGFNSTIGQQNIERVHLEGGNFQSQYTPCFAVVARQWASVLNIYRTPLRVNWTPREQCEPHARATPLPSLHKLEPKTRQPWTRQGRVCNCNPRKDGKGEGGLPTYPTSRSASFQESRRECIVTTETLHALRVGAMRHLACLSMSPLSLPHILTLDVQLHPTLKTRLDFTYCAGIIIFRVIISVSEYQRNERTRETADTRENPPTAGIIQDDSDPGPIPGGRPHRGSDPGRLSGSMCPLVPRDPVTNISAEELADNRNGITCVFGVQSRMSRRGVSMYQRQPKDARFCMTKSSDHSFFFAEDTITSPVHVCMLQSFAVPQFARVSSRCHYSIRRSTDSLRLVDPCPSRLDISWTIVIENTSCVNFWIALRNVINSKLGNFMDLRVLSRLPPPKHNGSQCESNCEKLADKVGLKRVYTEVTFSIGPEFIRHGLVVFEPITDLQGNKKRIPYCQVWGNTGATANQQTFEARLCKGLCNLAYRSARNTGDPGWRVCACSGGKLFVVSIGPGSGCAPSRLTSGCKIHERADVVADTVRERVPRGLAVPVASCLINPLCRAVWTRAEREVLEIRGGVGRAAEGLKGD
ncbi:hypothetical protein PR048_022437 [Dryococelus australis]|uniref:Uncharacterized protein n=1 Tax=Dryococelus australis TaxID=614101 RepID=A0ABQ9H125_9NEOP|nr:hypothetical protein PR048_022437 [Dryococelus australis]